MPPSRALSPDPSHESKRLTRAAVLSHFGAAKRVVPRQQVSSATGAGERDSARPAVDSKQAAEPEPESGTGTEDAPAVRPEKGSGASEVAAAPVQAQQPNVITSVPLSRADVEVLTAQDSSRSKTPRKAHFAPHLICKRC